MGVNPSTCPCINLRPHPASLFCSNEGLTPGTTPSTLVPLQLAYLNQGSVNSMIRTSGNVFSNVVANSDINVLIFALAEGEGIAFVSVCLFVCLFAQIFHVFLHNCVSHCDIIFTIRATTHVECCNDNYDVIGHVVRQPCWKKGKFWTSFALKPHQGKIFNLARSKYSSWE